MKAWHALGVLALAIGVEAAQNPKDEPAPEYEVVVTQTVTDLSGRTIEPQQTLDPLMAVRERLADGEFDAAVSLLHTLLESGSPEQQSEAAILLAQVHWGRGEIEQALGRFVELLRVRDRLSPSQLATALAGAAMLNVQLERHEDAVPYAEDWEAARQATRPTPMDIAGMGHAWLRLGEPARAAATLEEAIEAVDAFGMKAVEPWLDWLQQAYAATGAWAESIGVLETLLRDSPSERYEEALAAAQEQSRKAATEQ